MKDTRIESVP